MATETKEVKKKAPAKKAATKKVAKAEEGEAVTETSKGGSYLYAIGRRKSAIAKVRLIKNGKGLYTVNGKPMEEFFTTWESRSMVTSPIKIAGLEGAVDMSAETTGGGQMGQAEAVRLGISRALCELNPTYRKTLKKLGYLKRDPRAKERKKPGLRKARRAPQWSKR
ncbi:30S ribosomal protein S9 [Candidatus Uhrbacteria bacterium]|nr:30S ribosomal protein S9 [Candidatus Uhrbacteria bacterium]